ncbi:Lrp/AsnC family transcriptional regulator [Fibrobacter sp. UWB13]|uniref:Lrp/AsnC family transcriptional regulator n=1 Tax=Fibrobacter sp. UWB13 TaxID=1896204 RepID=UPI000A0C9F4F|nr:Lrp/AsnC family transcriptional regulator [Fibrobacter sp. UWB13]SMG11588.1 transcriptional regulator, AsnC family [Fibrobacter sp. UWB13]
MKKLGCNASRDVPQMLSQKLLAIIQDGFPLVERPYLRLAEMLNVSEHEVFDDIEKMRVSGVIRRIGGVYDSKKLGFISRLCAGKVLTSENDFAAEPHAQTPMEKFAAVVMSEPAITHNYIRSHEYNVWFTVIAENESAIQVVVDRVCSQTYLHDVHVLTATKKYKINTVMSLDERRGSAGSPTLTKDEIGESAPALRHSDNRRLEESSNFLGKLTDSDKFRIHIACDDIPHTLTPFKDWGVSCDELREDFATKRMRRFGAILRHQDAGFPCNAMVCFSRHSEDRRNEESSKVLALAKKHYISHCYERPSFENFPYNLYAMMHAQTPEELDAYIKESVALLDNPEYVVLHSLKELKKTSFRFFA